MTTAAVGLRPKIVVRSLTDVRGSAAASSPPLERGAGADALGRSGAAAGAPVDGALGAEEPDPLAEPEGPETEPLAEPDGVETDPLADPDGLLVCASATATRPRAATASRRMAMLFMLHLPTGN